MFGKNQEKLLEILKESGLIIVEGKKDRKVLEKMGLKNIVEISGKALEKVVDIIQEMGQQVIILTDYDKEGTEQYERLKNLLLSDGLREDNNIRNLFKATFSVNKIEELKFYLK